MFVVKALLSVFLFFVTSFLVAQSRATRDSLTNLLESVYTKDQVVRFQLDSIMNKFGHNSNESKKQLQMMHAVDSANKIIVVKVLDKYGWLSAAQSSENASLALFLVIQHSDTKTQLKYINSLKSATDKGVMNPKYYGYMLDRINSDIGKLQEYGSQVGISTTGKCYNYPIRDEPNVNNRRKKIGLGTMEEYMKNQFNYNYVLPKHDLYKNSIVLTGHTLNASQFPVNDVAIWLGNRLLAKTDADGFFKIILDNRYDQSDICFKKDGYNIKKVSLKKEGKKEVYFFLLTLVVNERKGGV